MIHLEPGHRIVSDTLAAAFDAPVDRREAVDVRCCDFGAQYHLASHPDKKHILRLSVWLRCYAEVEEAVGTAFFRDMYCAMLQPTPLPGCSLTLAVDLDQLPEAPAAKEELVRKLSSVKRDVAKAALGAARIEIQLGRLTGVQSQRSHNSQSGLLAAGARSSNSGSFQADEGGRAAGDRGKRISI